MRLDKKRVVLTAELAFVSSLVDFQIDKADGRLEGMYKTLGRVVSKKFKGIKRLSKREEAKAKKLIEQFGELTGWHQKPKHVVTMINFLLTMLEERKFGDDDIIPLLKKLFFHFERAKNTPPATFWSAVNAHKKWLKILEENKLTISRV